MRLLFSAVFLALVALVSSEHHFGICSNPFCFCAPSAHPTWTTINCTLPSKQVLNVFEGDLPDTTTELHVTGGDAVMFGANSLSKLQDARFIKISGPNLLVFRKSAAVYLNNISIKLEIDSCDLVRFEKRAFVYLKGPLSVLIENCQVVSVESEAFSWLLEMDINNVHTLELEPSAFMLDKTAVNIGEHGPGMMIALRNLTVSQFSEHTFGSSLAQVWLENIKVDAVHEDAFSANTYNLITAVNCSFNHLESGAFASNSLINNLNFIGCKVQEMDKDAVLSGVANLNITKTRFDRIHSGAINATVAVVSIFECEFHRIAQKAFEFASWSQMYMKGNIFDYFPKDGIVTNCIMFHSFEFSDNEIETVSDESLRFIGQAANLAYHTIVYKGNYFGQPCHCNISQWLANVLAIENPDPFIGESYCTVNDLIARCFNVPEQNMVVQKFIDNVCKPKSNITCELPVTKQLGKYVEPRNSRFPHTPFEDDEQGLSSRNKKVIAIVIVSVLACVVVAMIITFTKWVRRYNFCLRLKNLFTPNPTCCDFCERVCVCGVTNSIDNARSISQLSVHEYSERHCLNEPRPHEIQETTVNETIITDTPNTGPSRTVYPELEVEMIDKITQTMPEELSKELIEHLKYSLANPNFYAETRDMIEHLYELIKIEGENAKIAADQEENIYELPFIDSPPRIGKNNKQMYSVGTKTPSLEKLVPLSYTKQPTLAGDYSEPRDLALHLYAEIVNTELNKRNGLGFIPDVVSEQAMPRGPYLRAVRERFTSAPSTSQNCNFSLNTPTNTPMNTPANSPLQISTIKSNKSTGSVASGKMVNRPLPRKPTDMDAQGSSPSTRHG